MRAESNPPRRGFDQVTAHRLGLPSLTWLHRLPSPAPHRRPHQPAHCDLDNGGYVAHIVLNSDDLMVDGMARKLEPGMHVTAEVKTGARTVISYQLSPLNQYRQEGARER